MNATDKILTFLVDQDDNGLKKFIEQNPNHGEEAAEFSVLFKGFKGLREELFTMKLKEPSSNVVQLLKEAKKAGEVEQLTTVLKEHETQLSSTSTPSRIFHLNRSVLSIAASFIILVACGLWLFLPGPSASEFGLIGPSNSIRGNTDDHEYIEFIQKEDWTNYIQLYESEQSDFPLEIKYYYGVALMKQNRFKASNIVFQSIINEQLPQYEEYATFNIMVNLYQLGDSGFKPILNRFLASPDHFLYDQALKFKSFSKAKL